MTLHVEQSEEPYKPIEAASESWKAKEAMLITRIPTFRMVCPLHIGAPRECLLRILLVEGG